MIILGLGSNVGHCLLHLRNALNALKKLPNMAILAVSPTYISDALLPDDAPVEWDQPYLNLAIQCKTTQDPFSLLKELKKIEASISGGLQKKHWGPRMIDIDILALDDEIIKSEALTIPRDHLTDRPFALWPLADVAPLWIFPLKGPFHGKTATELTTKWGSRLDGNAPLHTRQINQRIDAPALVGVINVPPDSFSDVGEFLQVPSALEQARHLIEAGAEILDIGAESTAPSAKPLHPTSEWQRLQPVLSAIKTIKDFLIPPQISIDTRHVEVAKKALDFGINWINDVTGLQDARMRELVREANLHCVMMHHLSIPPSRENILPQNQDPVQLLYEWGKNQIELLEQSGISKDKIIFDPGIGFGKSSEHSLFLIKNISVFKNLGVRILVGHSRKSFLSLFTSRPFAERDIETVAMT